MSGSLTCLCVGMEWVIPCVCTSVEFHLGIVALHYLPIPHIPHKVACSDWYSQTLNRAKKVRMRDWQLWLHSVCVHRHHLDVCIPVCVSRSPYTDMHTSMHTVHIRNTALMYCTCIRMSFVIVGSMKILTGRHTYYFMCP